jgi:polygalacturonase
MKRSRIFNMCDASKRISYTYMYVVLLFIALIPGTNAPLFANGNMFYNVNDFGIQSDSNHLVTPKINSLIQSVHANGGGTIYFPAGTYLTGPIKLLSNITVFLEAGARIKFSDNFDDYLPMVESRYEGVDVKSFSPLFYAYNAENITITGRGVIDGQGKKWWDFLFELFKDPDREKTSWQLEFARQNKNTPMPDDLFIFKQGFCRPPFIQPMYCKNVRIEGITIVNSPFWTVNPEFCDNVTISGITIINPPSPNTDGINPESCTNVHISDCHISVGDDCITIKSGRDGPGREKASPAENYTITNCTMLSGHGGVVIGSEMSGDVRNIVISNCIFDGTDRGIRIKSTRGRGGIVENIRVSNIVMRDIRLEAIKLNLFYSHSEPEPVSERTPQFRNIHCSNITGTAKQAIAIIGLPEMPVSNVTFSDINLESDSGIAVSESKDIRFLQVTVNNRAGEAVRISNSSLIELDGFRSYSVHSEFPVISLSNVEYAFIHDSFQTSYAEVFLAVDGEKTKSVRLSNNYLVHIQKPVEISNTVPKGSVQPLKLKLNN